MVEPAKAPLMIATSMASAALSVPFCPFLYPANSLVEAMTNDNGRGDDLACSGVAL